MSADRTPEFRTYPEAVYSDLKSARLEIERLRDENAKLKKLIRRLFAWDKDFAELRSFAVSIHEDGSPVTFEAHVTTGDAADIVGLMS